MPLYLSTSPRASPFARQVHSLLDHCRGAVSSCSAMGSADHWRAEGEEQKSYLPQPSPCSGSSSAAVEGKFTTHQLWQKHQDAPPGIFTVASTAQPYKPGSPVPKCMGCGGEGLNRMHPLPGFLPCKTQLLD